MSKDTFPMATKSVKPPMPCDGIVIGKQRIAALTMKIKALKYELSTFADREVMAQGMINQFVANGCYSVAKKQSKSLRSVSKRRAGLKAILDDLEYRRNDLGDVVQKIRQYTATIKRIEEYSARNTVDQYEQIMFIRSQISKLTIKVYGA